MVCSLLSLDLFDEEIQQQQDIRLYDIEHAQMRVLNGFTLLLDVPGLAEAAASQGLCDAARRHQPIAPA